MRKLYADYADGQHLELWVPDDFTLYPRADERTVTTHADLGSLPLAPLRWQTTYGYEGWLDHEGLRFVSVTTNENEADLEKAKEILGLEPTPNAPREPAVLGDHRGQEDETEPEPFYCTSKVGCKASKHLDGCPAL